jgi:formate C-acetyltransferase
MADGDSLNSVTTFDVPRRLSAQTRELARLGLEGQFARQMVMAGPELSARLPDDGTSENMRYALAVRLVAENAPLRVMPDELVVGSATYLEAPNHLTPIHGGSSTSHLTLGFDRALKMGYRGLRRQIEERLARDDLDARGIDLLRSMRVCLDAAGLWHARHVSLLEERVAASSGAQRVHYKRVLENFREVPERPPRTFYEAVQALWSMFEFQRLCGNWSGLGRIDQMLGPYLEHDLAREWLTLDEAREILAHFWAHGTEWAGIQQGSGDAQHYQNVVLSGVDAQGDDVTNAVTYLVLDVIEELHISDFPVAVRINRDSPKKLLRRVAEVQRLGGGVVSIYNEDVVIRGLSELGIPTEEVRCFANDGCWEVLIPGKTAFGYLPFDLLEVLQDTLGLGDTGGSVPDAPTFEALYTRFRDGLSRRLDALHERADGAFQDGRPAPLVSLFIEDCVEKGRGYYDRGSRYVFQAPHAGGMADVANSFFAIRRLVYEEGALSLRQLVDVLRADWSGHEQLRRRVYTTFPAYGNDDEAADAMMQRVFDDYTGLVRELPYRNGVTRPAGISTFGREIEWRAHRKASAHGFKLGALLATNFSPTPGTDRKGPTAVMKSYCAVDFTRLPNGGTLELKLHPSSVRGEQGLAAMVGLLESFVRLGGFYLNVDVMDTAILRDAQKHPERYPNLAVRVSGWCARFNTLSKEWQDMIIQRTQQWA